ncbi:SRR1 domain-containing protein [Mycena sanguinolenta]|uniref:SRR1 domain-containing protein n=1 Tax=Mycena sanguinolenta TaxID=230812 RepID=A0A8H7DMY5_9AGAR|nr:SRR1 domain-containing protein [Mycena sanguinolenta]
MPRTTLVHPGDPTWRLRLHPTSPIFTQKCVVHGPSCPDALSIRLHHIPGVWTQDDRDAHPAWTHDLVDRCAAASHRCDDICRSLEKTHEMTPSPLLTLGDPTIFDEIVYFHGSPHWDAHWKSSPEFTLHPALAPMLTPSQTALVTKHLHQIGEYYAAMDTAGFFAKTADFVNAVFRSAHPQRPPYPTSAFGAGFSGFDRINGRGWDRAGYQSTEDHSQNDWELRSTYQIAYFIALGRIFQWRMTLATHLSISCFSPPSVCAHSRKRDPGLKRLRKFTNPTLFYAPGAEQFVITDAITRANPIENLIILAGDATWCGSATADFTGSYALMRPPEYITTSNGEAPCGEDNCLQWIPRSRVDAFNRARGPAREPNVRQMVMPDGSLEPDD